MLGLASRVLGARGQNQRMTQQHHQHDRRACSHQPVLLGSRTLGSRLRRGTGALAAALEGRTQAAEGEVTDEAATVARVLLAGVRGQRTGGGGGGSGGGGADGDGNGGGDGGGEREGSWSKLRGADGLRIAVPPRRMTDSWQVRAMAVVPHRRTVRRMCTIGSLRAVWVRNKC
jgi:hypothetical protein